MLNRRQFVQSAAVAGIATSLPNVASSSVLPDPQSSQPQSFGALPMLKGQARPITNDERWAQSERARALMVQDGLGAIVLTGGTSLLYYTNLRWGQNERMFARVGLLMPLSAVGVSLHPTATSARHLNHYSRGHKTKFRTKSP